MRIASRLMAITAVLGLLICCRPVRAEIVFVGLNADVEISDPVSVGDGSENLLMFQLTARGKNDYLLGGFDGTISGPLHQQSAGATTTPTLDEPSAGSTFVTDIDSHLLINTAEIVPLFVSAETLGAADSSAEAANAAGPAAAQAITSFGTTLFGAFAINPFVTEIVTNWPFAQIVVPGGSTVELHFDLGIVLGLSADIEPVSTSFVVGSPPALISDLNGNGFVDFEDLTVLLANWNKDVGVAEGNLVEPEITVVNFADLTVLLADWTGPGPAGAPEAALAAQAVPEPSSLLLILAGLGLLPFVRRR
ncbi:MAG: PEP-CTERM sorting domain-containing protein [Planctomycetes bacterium]|nr:PEP-CTERM sorting domain-containing protein [Planctomycetota bacterium]